MIYLYAAYMATWTIHIVYLCYLARGYARLKKEIEASQVVVGPPSKR